MPRGGAATAAAARAHNAEQPDAGRPNRTNQPQARAQKIGKIAEYTAGMTAAELDAVLIFIGNLNIKRKPTRRGRRGGGHRRRADDVEHEHYRCTKDELYRHRDRTCAQNIADYWSEGGTRSVRPEREVSKVSILKGGGDRGRGGISVGSGVMLTLDHQG